MSKTISQREARRLRKRVEELELMQSERFAAYRADYPGGVNVMTIDTLTDFGKGICQTATRIGAAIVCKYSEHGGKLYVYAVLP